MRVEAWREGESGRAEGVKSEERATCRWAGGRLETRGNEGWGELGLQGRRSIYTRVGSLGAPRLVRVRPERERTSGSPRARRARRWGGTWRGAIRGVLGRAPT
jgi:hypothetical protein